MQNKAAMFFATNLRVLRKHRKRSQEEVAAALGIRRSTYSAYENAVSEPNMENLLKISQFYSVSLERLLTEDLSLYSPARLDRLPLEYGADPSGHRLRVLATTVDRENNENIELVDMKVKAGYTAGYADPDFISVLPAFNLPFLDRNKKYRTFQIQGDSMPPVAHGSWVTGAYVQDWMHLRDGRPYIIVTRDEGAVFKVVYNRIQSNASLLLCSTNPAYEPYEVPIKDVLEVWQFVHFISDEMPCLPMPGDEIQKAVLRLQEEMEDLKKQMGQS